MHAQWSFVWKFRKKDLIPFFKPEENDSHVKETKTYGHHGFFVVLENMITTSLSKIKAVGINHSWNGICFRSNGATVQRFCATLIAYAFKNKASVICWKMFSHFSNFLCSWFELLSTVHLLETLNYCAEMSH